MRPTIFSDRKGPDAALWRPVPITRFTSAAYPVHWCPESPAADPACDTRKESIFRKCCLQSVTRHAHIRCTL